MNILGIRCSNTDFTYAVLTGTKAAPQLVETQTIAYPKGFAKAQSLKWLHQELMGLIQKHSVERIVMKASEGQSKGKPYEDRVEHEAMVYLAAADCGIKAVFKKVKSTIAKSLCSKGKASYLSTSLDTSVFSNFEKHKPKVQEAIFSGWSELI